MRSPPILRHSTPLLFFLIPALIFSTLPITTASSIIPHIWPRSPLPAEPSPPPSDFQDLGSVDTITGGEPTNSTSLDQDEPPPSNDSPLSTSLLANSSPPTSCASSHVWYTPDLLTATINPAATHAFVTDCFLAVQQLYLTEVHFTPRGNSRIEFVAPSGTAGLPDGMSHSYLLGQHVQETPLLYKANSCTLAIVLMGHFLNVTHELGGRVTLPGGIARGGVIGAAGRRGGKGRKGAIDRIAGKDTSTYRKLHVAGRMIENDCLRGWGRGGWVSAGDNDDIGVFLWATNSTLDLLFQPPALEHDTQLIGSGNGTSEQLATSMAPPAPSPTPKGGGGTEPLRI